MTSYREFDPAVLLSISTGRMFCDFVDLSEGIKWLCGNIEEDLATIGVLLMNPRAQGCLWAQFPDFPRECPDDWEPFVAELPRLYGDQIMVAASL